VCSGAEIMAWALFVCLETTETTTCKLVEEGNVCRLHTSRDVGVLLSVLRVRGREIIKLNRWMEGRKKGKKKERKTERKKKGRKEERKKER